MSKLHEVRCFDWTVLNGVYSDILGLAGVNSLVNKDIPSSVLLQVIHVVQLWHLMNIMRNAKNSDSRSGRIVATGWSAIWEMLEC